MIACPDCSAPTRVLETRKRGQQVRRVRVCSSASCAKRLVTHETIQSNNVTARLIGTKHNKRRPHRRNTGDAT